MGWERRVSQQSADSRDMHRYERQKQSPSPHLPTNYNPAGLDITKPIYRATRSPRVLRRTARTESIDFDNDIKEDGFAEEIQVRSLNANDCVPKKIRITARSNVSPDVLQYNLTLSSRNSAKTIIRKSWGSDFEEVRGVVFNGLAPRTQEFIPSHLCAIIAQAGGHEVRVACQRCQQSEGIFADCRINHVWPDSGACASCAYMSEEGSCSFVNHRDRKDDRKRIVMQDRTQELQSTHSKPETEKIKRSPSPLIARSKRPKFHPTPDQTPARSHEPEAVVKKLPNLDAMQKRQSKINKMMEILRVSPFVKIAVACQDTDLAKIDLAGAKRLLELVEEHREDVKSLKTVANSLDVQTSAHGLP